MPVSWYRHSWSSYAILIFYVPRLVWSLMSCCVNYKNKAPANQEVCCTCGFGGSLLVSKCVVPGLNGWTGTALIMKHDKFKSKKRKLVLSANSHFCIPSLPWLTITWLSWAQPQDHLNHIWRHVWIICHLITEATSALHSSCTNRVHGGFVEVRFLPLRLTVFLSSRHEMQCKVSK